MSEEYNKETEGGALPEESDESELHSILYGGEYSEYKEDLDLSDIEKEENEKKLNLSTFEEDTFKKDEKKASYTSTKSKKLLIAILGGVFVLLIAAYLILGPTGFDVFGFKETEQTPVVYTTGEVKGAGKDNWLIYEHVERNNIQSIEVHNKHGVYTVYYNPQADGFYFLGAETLSYNEELFSYLVVSAGYTVFADRLPKGERSDDLSEYGLSPDDNPAYFILTTRTGNKHKLYIGNPTLDEGRYYVMYEGRDIVYVLESSIEKTLLGDVRDILTPILSFPVPTGSNDYYTRIPEIYLTLNKDEPYVFIDYTKDDKTTEETFGVTIPYMLRYPDNLPASTEQVTSLFQYIINLQADELLEYDICYTKDEFDSATGEIYEEEEVKPEILLKYGIKDAEKALIYTYEGYPTIVYFSELQKDEDGRSFYYAWSPVAGILTKLSADKVPFLEWKKVDFMEKALFNAHIDKVGALELIDKTSSAKHYAFELTGKGDDLYIEETVSGKFLKSTGKTEGGKSDVYNFRQFYKSALYMEAGDMVDEPSEKSLIAQVKMTTRNGYEMVYEFYAYSDQRCYYTINGEGMFYVKRAAVQKLFSDAQRLLDGKDVNAESEY